MIITRKEQHDVQVRRTPIPRTPVHRTSIGQTRVPRLVTSESKVHPTASTPQPQHLVAGTANGPPERISSPKSILPTSIIVAEATCLQPVCQEYFRKLNISRYFQQEINCYCIVHYAHIKPKHRKIGGHVYTKPYGWTRFRIQTDQAHTRQNQIFKRWATSYYGTREEKLKQILRNRFMPFQGDQLLGGETFSDHSLDGQHCYTSPSIKYASDVRYSPIKQFRSSNDEVCNVQVVLQCKQQPKTFDIQRGRSDLCDIIPANIIEWKSSNRATIVPYGLMIRMVKRQ